MKVTLLSKPGCHLCEDARALLDELRVDHDFSLEEVDITTDPALFAQYRYEIPVVLQEGTEIARGRIEGHVLVRELRAAKRG